MIIFFSYNLPGMLKSSIIDPVIFFIDLQGTSPLRSGPTQLALKLAGGGGPGGPNPSPKSFFPKST